MRHKFINKIIETSTVKECVKHFRLFLSHIKMDKMTGQFLTILIVSVMSSLAQRSPYARRPIGYPVLETTSTTVSSLLGDRFGNGDTSSTTTERLPIEALGDRALFESLSKLPKDNQPFWLLNWRALEEHRKQGHTFQQRPNNFIDSSSFVSARQGPQNFNMF